MSNATGFQPNWASPPGETILKILERKGFSKELFAKQIDFSLASMSELIAGKYKINHDLASKLEMTLGPSSDFWIQLKTVSKTLNSSRPNITRMT